jgi:hypothetical protein
MPCCAVLCRAVAPPAPVVVDHLAEDLAAVLQHGCDGLGITLQHSTS